MNTVKRVGSHAWAVDGYADDRWHPIYPTKREAQSIADAENAAPACRACGIERDDKRAQLACLKSASAFHDFGGK